MRDESMARSFFGDGYVNQTQENIDNGNPFGVYESGHPVLSWINLMIHNIKVSFLVFVSGIFCGIPSLYLLAQNAAMVGVFDQYFTSKGFGVDFFLVVFVHGTLELTAIIIAGAAGLVLGKSFLFPGTIRRIDAFKKGAKDGVKVLIALMPVFALAGVFEGFIARLYHDISVLSSAVFALSVIFLIWYFMIYPIRRARK